MFCVVIKLFSFRLRSLASNSGDATSHSKFSPIPSFCKRHDVHAYIGSITVTSND